MLSCILGGRGSGKTTVLIKLLRMYVQSRSYDKIFWISPTGRRESKVQDFITDAEKAGITVELWDDYSDMEFTKAMDWMRKEIDEYKRYMHHVEVWKRFTKTQDPKKLSTEDLMALEEMGFQAPTTTYKHGYPSFGVVMDDMAGRKTVFTQHAKGVFSNFAILHRHLSCSVFILMQVHSGGIPRQLRANLSLWILFGCKSATLKKLVAEEVSFKIEPDLLERIWNYCTRDGPHSFLMLDYDEPDANKMFRKGFDKRVVLTSKDFLAYKNDDDANGSGEQAVDPGDASRLPKTKAV
jgi:hypothetical protein